jgi:hypothetical protein
LFPIYRSGLIAHTPKKSWHGGRVLDSGEILYELSDINPEIYAQRIS